MKSAKKFVRMMALAAVCCMLLTLGVFATENGSVWVAASSAEGQTVAAIMADGTVTDGVITLTADAATLTYQDVQFNENYVAMYAVNADTDGVVRISWVAPGEIDIQGEDWLMKVNYAGNSQEAVVLTGTVTGAQIGNAPADGEDPTDPVDPTNPVDPTDPTEDGTTPTDPAATEPGANKPGNGSTDTGDNSNLLIPCVVALACAAGIAALIVVMRKDKKGGMA